MQSLDLGTIAEAELGAKAFYIVCGMGRRYGHRELLEKCIVGLGNGLPPYLSDPREFVQSPRHPTDSAGCVYGSSGYGLDGPPMEEPLIHCLPADE